MDKPAIHAVAEFVRAGYPLDVEALLIANSTAGCRVDHLIGRVEKIAKGLQLDDGARFQLGGGAVAVLGRS